MLHAMFDLDRTDPAKLPFHFVWSKRVHAEPSPLRLEARDIAGRDPAAATATLEHGASALVLSDSIHLDTLAVDKQGEGWGLCVAQRREDGVLWVLIAGISGPATSLWSTQVSRSVAVNQDGGAQLESTYTWFSQGAKTSSERSEKRSSSVGR